jgi:hypothetical protein
MPNETRNVNLEHDCTWGLRKILGANDVRNQEVEVERSLHATGNATSGHDHMLALQEIAEASYA